MDTKKFLLDIHYQGGSLFYELAILVCPEKETKPILDYTNFVWNLDNIEGPYDKNGNKTNVDADLVLSGILNIEGLSIPFRTTNIIEEIPGTSWFDICFYESVL